MSQTWNKILLRSFNFKSRYNWFPEVFYFCRFTSTTTSQITYSARRRTEMFFTGMEALWRGRQLRHFLIFRIKVRGNLNIYQIPCAHLSKTEITSFLVCISLNGYSRYI